MKCFSEVRFFKWQDSDKSVSLRAKSASYGGGSEVLVVSEIPVEPCVQTITKGSTISMSDKES